MKNKDQYFLRRRESHPQVTFGLFLIVLGLALLVATNDMFHLGSVRDYFTWETAMIFVGLLFIVNRHFGGGLILASLGTWFLLENRNIEIPSLIRTIYWPSVIILIGLAFIISSLFGRKPNRN